VTDDPERLVAEALRAHAARTPLPKPEQATEAGPVFTGYGLLSGSEMAQLQAPEEPPTVLVPRPPDRTSRLEPDQRVGVGWVIVLALVLGLAAGAVVGLLTLL
jgi:hypothetical protein